MTNKAQRISKRISSHSSSYFSIWHVITLPDIIVWQLQAFYFVSNFWCCVGCSSSGFGPLILFFWHFHSNFCDYILHAIEPTDQSKDETVIIEHGILPFGTTLVKTTHTRHTRWMNRFSSFHCGFALAMNLKWNYHTSGFFHFL